MKRNFETLKGENILGILYVIELIAHSNCNCNKVQIVFIAKGCYVKFYYNSAKRNHCILCSHEWFLLCKWNYVVNDKTHFGSMMKLTHFLKDSVADPPPFPPSLPPFLIL